MKVRDLEELLASESGLYGEVTGRLQRLREARMLPDTRGPIEPRLKADDVVSALLSLVASRLQQAAEVTLGLRVMRPYGGPGMSFANAGTFADSIEAALESEEALASLIEIRCSDTDPVRRTPTLASITYRSSDRTMTAYYLPANLLATMDQSAPFDRSGFGLPVGREFYFSRRILDKLGQRVRNDTRWRTPASR